MSENDVTTAAERRLSGALDRLEAALTGPGSSVDLAAKLSEEKGITAQLTEKLTALKLELAERDAAPAPAPVEDLSAVVAERDAELAEARAALSEVRGGMQAELDALKATHDAEMAALKQDMEGAATGYAETLAAKDAELAQAKTAMAPAAAVEPGDLAALTALTDVTAELRAQASSGAVDAALINRAMEAEVEALRLARNADLAEMRTLLAELEPMLEESAHA